MRRLCKIAVFGFGAVYLIALGLLVVGTFGLFGQERDPLSGVFLLPIGLPWNLFLDGFGEDVRPFLAAAAPALNLLILSWICRLPGKGRSIGE